MSDRFGLTPNEFYSRPVVVLGASPGTATSAGSSDESLERVPAPGRFDVIKARETMRGWLAVIVLAVFGLEVMLFFGLAYGHVLPMQDIKELGLVLFSPTIVVVGTVLGFYFGADKSGRG